MFNKKLKSAFAQNIEVVATLIGGLGAKVDELGAFVDRNTDRIAFVSKEQEQDFRDITVLQTKIDALMKHLGLEFYKDVVSDVEGDEFVKEAGVRKIKKDK